MARRGRAKKPSLDEMIGILTQRYGNRLAPPLDGLAFRFTVYLPVLAKGKPVFTEQQRFSLYGLFHDCCGGFSQSSLLDHPPWHGSWLPDGGEAPIIDHHILVVVYTLQDAEADVFFREVKWMLEQDQVAGQQVVLIVQVPVRLMEAKEIVM